MLNKNVNFINKEKEIKKEKEVLTMKENKTFAPYNYNALMTAKVGKLSLRYSKGTKLIGYDIKFVTIKELCSDELYKEFTLNGLDIHQVFNTIAAKYKAGKTISASGMYQRAIKAIQVYNDLIIKEITPEIKLNKDAYVEHLEYNERQTEHRTRWEQLVEELGDLPDFDKLSNSDRELLLMRARDYGLEVPTETVYRKEIYNVRRTSVASEADEYQPCTVYNTPDDDDPYVTVVGKYKKTIQLRQAENEVMAMAIWFARHGDEFMVKCKPQYDIVCVAYDFKSGKDVNLVLYTGSKEQCLQVFDKYDGSIEHDSSLQVYRYCILPSDKEITNREARQLGVSEYESYGEEGRLVLRDFQYDASDVNEDNKNWICNK